jgi:hypothetical protein
MTADLRPGPILSPETLELVAQHAGPEAAEELQAFVGRRLQIIRAMMEREMDDLEVNIHELLTRLLLRH